MNYEQEVADADYPSIRLLQVKTVAFSPQDNVEMNMNGWQECSSATVPGFLPLLISMPVSCGKN